MTMGVGVEFGSALVPEAAWCWISCRKVLGCICCMSSCGPGSIFMPDIWFMGLGAVVWAGVGHICMPGMLSAHPAELGCGGLSCGADIFIPGMLWSHLRS